MDDIDKEKQMLVPKTESSTKQMWITFYNEEAAEAFETFKPERKPGERPQASLEGIISTIYQNE